MENHRRKKEAISVTDSYIMGGKSAQHEQNHIVINVVSKIFARKKVFKISE